MASLSNPPCKWLVPASREMALHIAANMAPEHALEIGQINNLSPVAAIAFSFDWLVETYALRPPGYYAPIFIMGVEPRSLLTGGAMVWMLGTEAIRLFPAAVLRAARWGIQRAFVCTRAAYVEQYIPAWYRTGIRFCRRLHFAVEPATLAGYDPVPVMHVRRWNERIANGSNRRVDAVDVGWQNNRYDDIHAEQRLPTRPGRTASVHTGSASEP